MRVADDLSSGRLENLADSVARIDFRKGDRRHRDFTREVMRDMQVCFHRRRAKVAAELSTLMQPNAH